MPRLPDVFGQPVKPSSSSTSRTRQRHLLRVLERRAGLRVDVDAQLVGVVDVGAPRRPRVEVDRCQIGRPRDLRDLGHAELVRVPAGRERDARGLDPLGTLLRHALLVDRLALGAVGMPLQLCRPLVQRADDPLGHGDVVLDVVELGRLQLPVEDLVRIGHLDRPAADLQLHERRRHARISPFRGMPVLAGPVNTWRAGFPLTYPGTCGGPLSTPRGGFPRFWGRSRRRGRLSCRVRRSGRVAEGGALLRR